MVAITLTVKREDRAEVLFQTVTLEAQALRDRGTRVREPLDQIKAALVAVQARLLLPLVLQTMALRVAQGCCLLLPAARTREVVVDMETLRAALVAVAEEVLVHRGLRQALRELQTLEVAVAHPGADLPAARAGQALSSLRYRGLDNGALR